MFDVSQINDKLFHIYKKVFPRKGYDELRYSFGSIYNKPIYRHVNDMYKLVSKANLFDAVYIARPALYLSLENEYLTWKIMDKLKSITEWLIRSIL